MKAPLLSDFKGRRIFVTGDTGFKGAWLSLWLNDLGAKVTGYALPPEHPHDLFHKLRLKNLIRHQDGDIRDARKLAQALKAAKPEFVFHLAAQALVRRAYAKPEETFETNVIGSANLLEAVRGCPSVRSLVYVTSDKCYLNKNFARGYREDDALGGEDPYSASKACAEMVFKSYLDSFLNDRPKLGAASARAGNVIGGDWAEDRLVPDIVTAIQKRRTLVLRNPNAVRPWQHVLEPLYGYMLLALKLRAEPARYSGPWNFGPEVSQSRSVLQLGKGFAKAWGASLKIAIKKSPLHEARVLRLDATKARKLGWSPRLDFNSSIKETASWYKASAEGSSAIELTRQQIKEYLL